MENNLETQKKRKPMKGKQKRSQKPQEDTQDETAKETRSSIDHDMNMLHVFNECTVTECDGENTKGGRSGPEDHDNHCA